MTLKETNPIIIKDKYQISGSDMAQSMVKIITKDAHEVSGSPMVWMCPECRTIHKDQTKRLGRCDKCKNEQ